MRYDVLTKEFVLPLWKERNFDVIDKFVAPTADVQTTFLAGIGPNALKRNAEETFNAFSSLELIIEHVIQRENKLIYQWRARAVHTGPLLNVQPTGLSVTFSGVVLGELHDKVITQYHSFTNIPQVFANIEKAPYTGEPLYLAYSDKEHVAHIIRNATGKRLTGREIECLSYWLKGFSIKNTARLLGGLSSRTVQTFRENIKRKFNVESYQQLLKVIQESGIMPLFLDNITPTQPYVDIFEMPPLLRDVSGHR